jgi:hypothetical protein
VDGLIPSGTINIVRRVRVTAKTLQEIAKILGIPEDERDRLVSGIVYIESGPRPARRRAARSSTASGAASRTTPRRK